MENKILSSLIVTFFAFLYSTGCVSKDLEGRLASARSESSNETLELLRLNESSEAMSLSWKQAVSIMEERSPYLKQFRLRNEQLRKQRDEQWKTWLPRLGFYSNLQTSLAELGSLSFSDINTALVAPLVIPNPFTEQAKALENGLSCLESEDSLELAQRRQVISLYRIFSKFERSYRLTSRNPLTKDLEQTNIQSELSKLDLNASDLENFKANQAELAQFLNLPGSQPIPISSTRPRISYEGKIQRFVPGTNYGQLAVRLSAYQIVGALLREKGIKLQRWPSFSVSGSSPTIYDSRSDSSIGDINSEQISLFGGLSKTYEFTGRDIESVRTAEENTQFVKESLRLRLDQETREWLRLKHRYQQLLIKRTLASERLKTIRSQTSGGSAVATITAVRDAVRALEAVDQAKEQLDLEIWLWDDQQWRKRSRHDL